VWLSPDANPHPAGEVENQHPAHCQPPRFNRIKTNIRRASDRLKQQFENRSLDFLFALFLGHRCRRTKKKISRTSSPGQCPWASV